MFTKRQLVRFQHCDPAGMVFYPRYLDMAHATVEDWFSDKIGMSFADIHGDRRSSVPVVSLSMTFHAPSRLGDVLELRLSVEKIGETSLQIVIAAFCREEARFTAPMTLVQISMEDYRPRPWDEAIRQRFLRDDAGGRS
ncbi:MAG: acyl-CoA thioesterase [Bradyrhizobium sp.]|uniref:acyl-CoA thioesterase n=1 Tax=Bradyrhizobium sp. TaxID=376 RepID=UPI003BEFC6F0